MNGFSNYEGEGALEPADEYDPTLLGSPSDAETPGIDSGSIEAIYVGEVARDDSALQMTYPDDETVQRHVGVRGTTGSGKTENMRQQLEREAGRQQLERMAHDMNSKPFIIDTGERPEPVFEMIPSVPQGSNVTTPEATIAAQLTTIMTHEFLRKQTEADSMEAAILPPRDTNN